MGYGGVDMKERRGTNSKLGLMGVAVNGDAAPHEPDPIVTRQPPHEKAREKRTLYPLHIFNKSGLDEKGVREGDGRMWRKSHGAWMIYLACMLLTSALPSVL